MSKIFKPVIEEVKYESGSLDTLQETLKISFVMKTRCFYLIIQLCIS